MSINFLKKKAKKEIKKLLYYKFHWYKGKYLGIHLQGGLCNKLHFLISACDIAIKEESYIIEPFFGWKKNILFSDIYDLDYFNFKMQELTNGRSLLIPKSNIDTETSKRKSIDNVVDLWAYSEKELMLQRKNFSIKKDATKLKVLNALRLKPEFEEIVDLYTKNKTFTAVQIRTESDWINYAKTIKASKNERILVPLEDILNMISDFEILGDLFFTSGENHLAISENISNLGLKPYYFYESNFEYELNAAINFEICCKADYFIGLSRSSYSNLITLKRACITGNDQSFIYNFKNKIFRRKDKGIQYIAKLSINKKTKIT